MKPVNIFNVVNDLLDTISTVDCVDAKRSLTKIQDALIDARDLAKSASPQYQTAGFWLGNWDKEPEPEPESYCKSEEFVSLLLDLEWAHTFGKKQETIAKIQDAIVKNYISNTEE